MAYEPQSMKTTFSAFSEIIFITASVNSCDEYMLTAQVAKNIINEVVEAIKDWRIITNKIGISKREISLFENVFEGRINQVSF